jgi:hypothetical protein
MNKRVRPGCSLSPILFNIDIDRIIKGWLQVIKQKILAKILILNRILLADDQAIVARTEDELQRAAYIPNNIAVEGFSK